MKTSTLISILTGPLGWIAAYWVVAALSYALPQPCQTSSVLYVVIYRLLHFTSANLDKMRQSRCERPTHPLSITPPDPVEPQH